MDNHRTHAFASNETTRLSRMQERRESRFRDYAYVSARKVVRMSRTLEPSAWSRVQEVERAIRRQFGIQL
jgi:hypothetical protein